MLVLSRKRMESIRIGEDIRIQVIRLHQNEVRLGIEAPRGVTIVREELLDRAPTPRLAPCTGRTALVCRVREAG